MSEAPTLSPHHVDQPTQGSGISPEVITERGYSSILPPGGYSELKLYGFSRTQANLPGLLLPVWTTDGRNGLMVYRPDTPRLGRDGKPIKYEILRQAGVRVDCSPRCRPTLADPAIPLWITEGQKKADALTSRGLCAIALLGVWNFKGRNPFGGTTVLADFDHIAWDGRDVRIVFDNDIMTKTQVRKALDRLTEHLQRKYAHVSAVYLPQDGGKKVGIDDYLLIHTIEDLAGLVEAPHQQPQPAASVVTLLDGAPQRLTRPLMFVDEHAYAMTWLWTGMVTIEKLGSDGDIQRLPESRVTQEWRLFIIRDDGGIFADVSDAKVTPLREIGLTVQMPDPPRDDLLWRTRSVKAYYHGVRPDVKDIFQRIVRVYDHCIDFSRSLDEQPLMCQVSACLSLMTWFADAFTVLPYPWPNSPAPGSGKTKWGHCWTKTSYLGYLTQPAIPSRHCVTWRIWAPRFCLMTRRRSPIRKRTRISKPLCSPGIAKACRFRSKRPGLMADGIRDG